MRREPITIGWLYSKETDSWSVKIGDREPISQEEFWDKYGEEYNEELHGDL